MADTPRNRICPLCGTPLRGYPVAIRDGVRLHASCAIVTAPGANTDAAVN